ncbi:MAG: hypothetical protein ACI9SC_001928 [Gammaproteobacteria bacterium]|jgi:hypothetical protein
MSLAIVKVQQNLPDTSISSTLLQVLTLTISLLRLNLQQLSETMVKVITDLNRIR